MDIKFNCYDSRAKDYYTPRCHKAKEIAIDNDVDYVNGHVDDVKVCFKLVGMCGTTSFVEAIDLTYTGAEDKMCETCFPVTQEGK